MDFIKNDPSGAKLWLKDLGKNGFYHSCTVEDYLGKIIQQSNATISPEESYLLLHSIYLHDLGYLKDPKNHPQETYDLIKYNYQNFHIYDKYLAKALAIICLAHGQCDLSKIKIDFPIDILNKTETFDLRFLGSLLRLADDLDEGYLRILYIKGQEESHRSYITHIDIGPQLIKIKSRPNSKTEWEKVEDTRTYIQNRLDEMKEILGQRSIKIEEIQMYPRTWSEDKTSSIKYRKRATDISIKGKKDVLFLFDHSQLGLEIMRDVQVNCSSLTLNPIYLEKIKNIPMALEAQYPAIICILGEDFENPLHDALINKIIQNTSNGGGLILFPFVAWSALEGINDRLEDLLPVTLKDGWHEASLQSVSYFSNNYITKGIKEFKIRNTYEILELKNGSECICKDSKDNPFIVIGSYREGKVAYLNISTHSCLNGKKQPTLNLNESPSLRKLLFRTIKWACGDRKSM